MVVRQIFAGLLVLTAMSVSRAAERPNILFFYADDLGYGDLGCYGSKQAQTPRLDALAKEGTRFTQFYVSHCVCSPTRSSAITGHFPSRHRIFGHLAFFSSNERRGMPNWLDVNAPSLPRALQQIGYRTAMIGKWHLGGGSGSRFQMEDLRHSGRVPPKDRSIVVNHPDAPPVADYGFDHARTTIGNSPTWKAAKPWPQPHELYPHVEPEWLTWSSRAIADEAIVFLEQHRREFPDQPFYANVWFKDPHVPLTPTADMLKPFTHLEPKARLHYATIRFMDEQIGHVLDRLDELGMRENTLVIFSSDNGAGKGRGGSNGPLRGWKHTLYEGGIREPFIVRWPGQSPAGKVDTSSVLNLCDLIPTLTELTGAKMPDGYESDGENILPALRGKPFSRSKIQFWHYPATKPALAIRAGGWKLLTDLKGERAELYNLSEDLAESKNLASEQPAVRERLKQQLRAWYAELPTRPRQK
ncbi:MAG: sulfatase-like hydrolase/transferase [Limisphaerales bacterium]